MTVWTNFEGIFKVGAKSFRREAGSLAATGRDERGPATKERAMTADDQDIHRHTDGAIDFDYYRRQATLLRSEAFRQMAFRMRAIIRRVASQSLHF